MFRELLTRVRVRTLVARRTGPRATSNETSGTAVTPPDRIIVDIPAQVLNLPIFALEDRCTEMSISAENCDGPKKI
jgi:hypothetical protein